MQIHHRLSCLPWATCEKLLSYSTAADGTEWTLRHLLCFLETRLAQSASLFFSSNKLSTREPHLPLLQKVWEKYIVPSISSKRAWRESRPRCWGLPVLNLCATLMQKLKSALMPSNDNWPYKWRVATTSSISLTSNISLPSVMNQTHPLEVDDITLQKAIWSKSNVQGAIPVISFWIGLLVHGKAWDYSEVDLIIKNSPGRPREAQNTGETPPHQHRWFSVLLTFILRDFREPSRKACPPNKERKREKTKYYIFAQN